MAGDAEARGYWGLGGRACDTCHGSPALLYCRADSAFLCGACDSRVHAGNRLASRHERVWVCEVCEQSPAVVTCKADAAALCSSCDADIHSANPLARRHDRSPIIPFFDTPSSAIAASSATATWPAGNLFKPSDDDDENDAAVDEAEAASWILPNPNPKSADLFFADVDPYLDLEYTDSVVPFQTKPIPPPIIAADHDCIELDFIRSKASFSTFSTFTRSVSSSEVGVVPDGTTMADVTNPYGGGGKLSTALDREARVMRYREKRKNRRFEKTIRYASRKAYAETRPRIKGRFAKRSEIEPEVDHLFSAASAAAALMVDPGYGVVPSF